jgi:hypothetical protein
MFSTFNNPHLSSTTQEILRNGRGSTNNGFRRNDENSMVKHTPGKGKGLTVQKSNINGKLVKTPGAKSMIQQPARRALGDISNRKDKGFGTTSQQGNRQGKPSNFKKQEGPAFSKQKQVVKKASIQPNSNKAVSFSQSSSSSSRTSLQPSAISLRPSLAKVQPVLKQMEPLSQSIIQEKTSEDDDGSSVSSVEFPAGRLYCQEPGFGKNDLPPFELDINIDFEEEAYMRKLNLQYEEEDQLEAELRQKQVKKMYQEDFKDMSVGFGYPEDKFTLDELLEDDDHYATNSKVGHWGRRRSDSDSDSDSDISL